MKQASRNVATALAALLIAWQAPVSAHGDGTSRQDVHDLVGQLRAATQKYHDVSAAEADGYAQFLGCIAEPGHGAMGIHYLNGALAGDAVLDPLQPEALVYEPRPGGRLALVGVEYIVFQAAWDALHPQPPALFGHPFHLVREPNRYGVPPFYELHVWAWKHNTGSLFDDWNPRVECP